MKYKILKKRIITQGCIITGIVAALGAGVYFLSSFSDDYTGESTSLESEVDAINLQTRTVRDKFTAVQKEVVLYNQIMTKFTEGGLSVSRQILYNAFGKYKNDYILNDLRLTMGPVAAVSGADYKRPTYTIVSSDITTEFSTVSDEHVFGMLDAMPQQLSGQMRITGISLSHLIPLSSDVLHTISEKGMASLVKGSVKFAWLALKQ